jgi:hypothetical protein
VLINLLGLYPLGSAVKLDSGEVAVVYHNFNDPRLFEKPWVKVVRAADGSLVKKTVIRNLAEHQGAGGTITGMARPGDVAELDAAMLVML